MSVLNLLQAKAPEKAWNNWVLPEEDDAAWAYVKLHPEKKYNIDSLLSRKKIDWSMVHIPVLYGYTKRLLATRDDFPWSLVEKYPNYWNYNALADVKKFDFSVINKVRNQYTDWYTASNRATDADVRLYPTLRWDRVEISRNKSVTLDTLFEFNLFDTTCINQRLDEIKIRHLPKLKNKFCNTDFLVEKFSLDEIFSLPDFDWDWTVVEKKEGFSWDKVDFSTKNWNYISMSYAKTLPMSTVLSLDEPWHWEIISRRVDWLTVYCNPDKPWHIYTIESRFATMSIGDTLNKIIIIQKWWLKVYYRPLGKKYQTIKGHFHTINASS